MSDFEFQGEEDKREFRKIKLCNKRPTKSGFRETWTITKENCRRRY